MSERSLHRFTRRLDAADRAAVQEIGSLPDGAISALNRSDGTPIGLSALISLRDETLRRIDAGEWSADRGLSDQWLAPRLHYVLRVSRAIASDRSAWEWLAVTLWSDYVVWRWTGEKGVTDDRWYGPINKQALARLWWGGELFRDGSDYAPASRAFIRQDLRTASSIDR